MHGLHSTRLLTTLAVGTLAVGTLAGCSSSDDTSDTGQISLAVTDAPVDNADAVVVSFTEVQLLGADEEPRQTFTFNTPRQIDLLALQGTNSEFLVSGAVVPSGSYEEVRLIVDAPNPSCQNPTADPASYITIDGVDFPLVVPSGAQSGLKVKGPITVAAGGQAAYTVDFDLRKSIAERDNNDCYNLRPVLRVVDNAEVGALAGTIDGDLLAQSACTADSTDGSGAAVYVYAGADAVAADIDGTEPEPLTTANIAPLADDSGDFSYEVGFLLAGDYTAAFTCQSGDDDPEAQDTLVFDPVVNVSIAADTLTTQDFAITAAAGGTP